MSRRTTKSSFSEEMISSRSPDLPKGTKKTAESSSSILADNEKENESCSLLCPNKIGRLTCDDRGNLARITQCVKLFAQNKICAENAFNCDVIDLMVLFIERNANDLVDLRAASMLLQAAVKVYECRIEHLHDDVVRLGNSEENGNSAQRIQKTCKDLSRDKSAKSRSKILVSIESLRGKIKTVSLDSLLFQSQDSQSSDMLFQATLPLHARSVYLHPYNDVILDTIENCSGKFARREIRIAHSKIENFADLHLCESFANFEFLQDNEESDETESLAINQTFSFDLSDVSLPMDNSMDNLMDNFETSHEIVNFHRQAQGQNEDKEKIVNADEGRRSKNYYKWNLRSAPKRLAADNKKKISEPEAEINNNEYPVSHEDEAEMASHEEFNVDVDDIVTSGQDSLDCWVVLERLEQPVRNLPKIEEVDVDFDNIVDSSQGFSDCWVVLKRLENLGKYSPGRGGNAFEIEETREIHPRDFVGDNLVPAPKIVQKIVLPFSRCAKQIDMGELKDHIWRNLDIFNDNDDENIKKNRKFGETEIINECTMMKDTRFSEIYQILPKNLGTKNVEALSVPIAFLSLLHLANETNLRIDPIDDHSDLIILQD